MAWLLTLTSVLVEAWGFNGWAYGSGGWDGSLSAWLAAERPLVEGSGVGWDGGEAWGEFGWPKSVVFYTAGGL